jgi:hypothetical protein
MQWYHYFSGFWAGMFLANFVPHFIKGIAGDPFPTPFSKPPGKGLSSALVNVLWALFNLVAGYLLFRLGKVSADDSLSLLICFAGFTSMSIMGARNFVHKDKV